MQRKEDILSRLDELLTAELPDLSSDFDFDDDLLLGLGERSDGFDDLTPATLLREHGSLWATRPGEDDAGLDDPDAYALSEALEMEKPRHRLH